MRGMRKILKNLFLISIVVISGFLLAGCTVSQEEIDEYNRIISDADILVEGKEYTLAIEKLSDATEAIPNRIDAFERMINIFLLKNRADDAIKIIEESGGSLSQGDKAILYSLVGDAYYEANEYDKALYSYQLAQGMSDDNMNASLGLAKSYLQKGETEKFKSFLNEKYEAELLVESKLLSSYILGLSNTKQASELIREVEPGDKWREAYKGWSEVLNSLNDDDLFNSAKLGKEYIDRGFPYLAIALLEPKLGIMKEYADGVYILGKAYYEYGDYQKSIDVLENASSLGDLNQYIYWILARDYNLLDDINSSISYYDNAISYGGSEVKSALYIEYIDILIEENLTEKALAVMVSAEKIFEEVWVPISYINIYSARGDIEKAHYYVSRVTLEDLEKEDKREFLFAKANYLIKASKLEEAEETLNIYWELDPYDPGYNLLMAMLKQKGGSLDEAKDYAKKAIEYDLDGEVSKQAQTVLAQID